MIIIASNYRKTSYDGENSAVLSEEKSTERNASGNSSDNSVTNYQVPVTVESIVGQAGKYKNIKVAVLVNYAFENKINKEGITERVYTPRPNAEIAKLGAVVQNATGYDPSRGDQFQITSMPFDDTNNQELQRALKEMNKKQMIYTVSAMDFGDFLPFLSFSTLESSTVH